MVSVQTGTKAPRRSRLAERRHSPTARRAGSLYDACDGAALRARFGGPGEAPRDAAGGRLPAGRASAGPLLPHTGAARRRGVVALGRSSRVGPRRSRGVDGQRHRHRSVVSPPRGGHFTRSERARGLAALADRLVRRHQPVSSFSTPKAWQMWRPADLEAPTPTPISAATAANSLPSPACAADASSRCWLNCSLRIRLALPCRAGE
jgi:hypothetical protein